MQSTAKDVTSYLEEVPAERKAALEKLRKLCLIVLKGFEESMQYGNPCYSRNGVVEVGFASQKHFIGLYILRTDVMKTHKDLLKIKGVSLGKGCIRFRSAADVDEETVRALLVATLAGGGEIC